MDINGSTKNRIFCTGDLHGHVIERFSYTKNPELRNLNENDIIVCLGDIGISWPGREKETKYILQWLNNRPESYIFIRGNHDNEPWWESCPPAQGTDNIKLLHGDLRQAAVDGEVFEKIFLVTSTADLEICGKRCLCIGGANSTDVEHLYYPHQKQEINECKKRGYWYRVIGRFWWPGEGINLPYLYSTLTDIDRVLAANVVQRYDTDCKFGPHFDFILTHDSPAAFCDVRHLCYRRDRMVPTHKEVVLDYLRIHADFGHWYHGHQHVDGDYLDNCHCLYWDLVQIA